MGFKTKLHDVLNPDSFRQTTHIREGDLKSEIWTILFFVMNQDKS